jgi:hypothetical protein
MEKTGTSTPEEAVRPLVASLSISGATNPPAPHVPSPTHRSTAEDGGLREACRTGCIAAIDAALRLGTSISTVPVTSVVPKRKPITVVGGSTSSGSNREDGKASTVKALTLQLAARGRQVDTFSHLLSIGARLDEPGTSVASIRSLIRLVTRGPDGPALLRLFFGANLAHQLDQEMRNEALLGLIQGYNPPPRSSSPVPAFDERVEFARALLDDFGASPDFFRGPARRPCTSTLSAAVLTLSPDLVRLLLDHGACPDGPPDLQRQPVSERPFHVPLYALAHALAGSLLDPPAQAALRQIADMLLDRGADTSVCVPYLGASRWFMSFANPLVVFLDAIDCWDDDGGGPQALDALRFLLDRGMSPDRPPIHASQEGWRPDLPHWGLVSRGPVRRDPVTDLLDKWGLAKLASPAFTSALEMLAAYHPRNRGGIERVAEVLAKYDYYRPSPTSSSSSLSSAADNTTIIIPQTQDDIILDAWRRIISSTARLLNPFELGEFFYAYAFTKASCPRFGPQGHLGYHGAGAHKIGDLATTTVVALLAAGADVNHRHRRSETEPWRNDAGHVEVGPMALHSICRWLAGHPPRAPRDPPPSWQRDCGGFRHTPDRAGFIRFLVEECGADPRARFQGRTPAEILVQLRRPELDAEETWEGPSGRDMEVVAAARRELVAFLEEAAAETV